MLFRGSGILNHVTSLPAPFGIGDLGPAAHRFIDFLARARQRYWQVLPLNPVHSAFGFSPYSSSSAFAGNPLLISPESLFLQGFLQADDLPGLLPPVNQADFTGARRLREKLLTKALASLRKGRKRYQFEQFCHEQTHWLEDYALFSVLKNNQGGKAWHQWPHELRDRLPDAIEKVRSIFHRELETIRGLQYLFFCQWHALKNCAQAQQIRLIGDLPLYIVHDSADVWVNPGLFLLDTDRRAAFLSGTPAGIFSPQGQCWGHPLYHWEAHRDQSFHWWIKRLEHNLALFDRLRLDHFQGFFRFWAIPFSAKTALAGHWMPGPGVDFFQRIVRHLNPRDFIAEDLGVITPDTREAMRIFHIPGTKPLTFAFDGNPGQNPFAPHNLERNTVVYTGTHDMTPLRGWHETEASRLQKQNLRRYLGRNITTEKVAAALIHLAMMSVADTVIITLQDILGLGTEARMNRPGTLKGNWSWRHGEDWFDSEVAEKLAALTELSGRV